MTPELLRVPADRWRAMTPRTKVQLEWAVLGLLVAEFVWKGIVPGWLRLNNDFQNYYLTARLYRGGFPLDRVTEVVWFERQKGHAQIPAGVGKTMLSPFSALLVAPLAGLSPLVAKDCWLLIDVSALAAAIALLGAMTRLPLRRVALIAFLTVVPLRTNFQFGQQYVVLLFLLALACWLHLRGRGFASGVILAIAAALKLYPVAFGLFLLLKRRWSSLAGLASTLALLVGAGAALFGPATLRSYVTLLPRMGTGELNHPYWVGSNTATVLIRRLFVAEPDLNPFPLANAPMAYVIVQPCLTALLFVPACWLITRDRQADGAKERLQWGAFVGLLLVLSPTGSTYHCCVLILTTVFAVDFLLRARRRAAAVLLLALHALLCAPVYRFVPPSPSGWGIFLGTPRLYLLFGYWGVVLWTLARVPEAKRAPPPEAAALALAFAVLVFLGVRSNARHFDGLLDSAAARVPVTHGTSAGTGPSVGARNVYFARMADEGFVLDRAGDGLVTQVPPETDLFHPAVPPVGHEGWVEVSSDRSRIARFELSARTIDVAALPVDVENAEQPAISTDGRWLAFLREERGRGALWVADRGASEPRLAPPFVERELVDATHDVFDLAFFPDDRIVFAARRGLGSALFVVGPAGGSRAEIAPSDRPTRYPAVSADGRWLAFSRQEHGAWQLHVMNLTMSGGGAERSLTHADCNSVEPAWEPDSRTIVYATDCGRDIADTAINRIVAW
ncbi:MAG: glycosyltransferase 87 family protein [Myxococcota bacterium]|nr:glycosyltransferase 87 family protein [Myxococcota bacterium]